MWGKGLENLCGLVNGVSIDMTRERCVTAGDLAPDIRSSLCHVGYLHCCLLLVPLPSSPAAPLKTAAKSLPLKNLLAKSLPVKSLPAKSLLVKNPPPSNFYSTKSLI